MRIVFTLTLLLLLVSTAAFPDGDPDRFNLFPDPKDKKPETVKTNLQLGIGGMESVLYLERNIKENNNAYGYAFHMNYGGHKLLRFSMQYTLYKPIDIDPTWYNIHAQTLEANMEVLARFPNGKSFLYPFVGLSYNSFKGFFTGFNDYLNLKEFYKINTTVRNTWLGVNIGTGFEHAFGPIVVFLDYRMRVGKMDHTKNINIMDVCYGGGVRVKLSVPKIHLAKIFRPAKNKYTWF